MRTQLKFFVISLFIFTISSCNSSQLKEREIALKEKELELRQKELDLEARMAGNPKSDTTTTTSFESQVQQPEVKYMYVVMTTNEPKLMVKIDSVTDDGFKTTNYVKPHYFTYTSDVIQVADYTEDKRYMVVDNYEKTIRPTIVAANRRIEMQKTGSGRYDDAEAKIIARKSYVFNSYVEASEHRAATKNVDR